MPRSLIALSKGFHVRQVALSLCSLLLLCCLPLAGQELPETLVSALAAHETAEAAPLLPRRHLFQERPIEFAALSPDGRHVIGGRRSGVKTHLSLLDTADLDETPLFSSDRIRRLWWTADSAGLVLELDGSVGVVALSAPHSPSYITRLERRTGDYVLGPDNHSMDQVLVVRRKGNDYVLERVGFAGETEMLLTSNIQIEQVLSGANPDEQFLVLQDEQGHDIYRHADGMLTKLLPCGLSTLAACGLLAYDRDSGTLWLNINGGEDLAGLYAWSAATGELRRHHGDPQGRVDLYRTVLEGSKPIVTAYYVAGLQHHALDPAVQPVLLSLQALLPDSILEFSVGENDTWLVKEDSALLRESRYHLFGPEQQLRQILFTDTRTPVPEPAMLSSRFYLEYSATDQLMIKAYLSVPKGVDIATAPLVALIHGGPWGRIDASYSHITQLLVNRGYVVFEPNFRASTGYGSNYVLAANKDFGRGRVQQDITDGVHYLLQQGIGDPARVAIVGASFGGFSVLAGLAFTPELYRVGVAMVPPADLAGTLRYSLQRSTFVARQPSIKSNLVTLAADVDDPMDMQRLYQQSPLANLDAITAPLLVIAGADDDRIDIRQVKDFSLKLLNQGKGLSLLIDENEGHGFLSNEASEASLFLMEEMLALHLGGRREGLDDSMLKQYLRQRLLLNTNAGFLAELEAQAP